MKTVLITGASTGIGYEIARCFAQDGYTLFLVARENERLASAAHELGQTYNVHVIPFAQDLSEENAAIHIMKEIANQGLSIDVLVNNAGFGSYGPFAETQRKEQLDMIQVNVRSLVDLTHHILPGMIERKHGRILNVASTAAFEPGPYMATYFATKAFVLSFSEALQEELRDTSVTVTTLCPGPTVSQFSARANTERIGLFRSPMPTGRVAQEGYNGLMRGKTIVIPGWKNRLLIHLLRVTPRFMVVRLVKRILQPITPR
ncbi:MAG TPA: SDR family oxidoreductase [Candidatus Kapabacteria bacterium]|nr:SDR family oxidoreductase [Candidatus Kapabacteria bacterium]